MTKLLWYDGCCWHFALDFIGSYHFLSFYIMCTPMRNSRLMAETVLLYSDFVTQWIAHRTVNPPPKTLCNLQAFPSWSQAMLGYHMFITPVLPICYTRTLKTTSTRCLSIGDLSCGRFESKPHVYAWLVLYPVHSYICILQLFIRNIILCIFFCIVHYCRCCY